MNAIRQNATPGLGKITRVLLAAICLLLFGCGQDFTQQGRVLVKRSLEKDADRVGCWNCQRSPFFAGAYARAAKEAGKDSYGFLAFSGDLLMVHLSRKDDTMKFPYIFRGDEKMPLDFTRRNGLVLLGGEVVCVDLNNPAGVKWLSKQPRAKMKAIRTLLLSNDDAVDVPSLQCLAGQGIMVHLVKPYSVNKYKLILSKSISNADTELAKALIAAKPVGLMVGVEMPEKVIAQLSSLTHLVIAGPQIPNLSKLKNLRFLSFAFNDDKPSSLAPLAELTQLQGLRLVSCKHVSDFSPLRKLDRLRSLSIDTKHGLKNLEFLTGMSDLRSLCLGLGDKDKLKSIAPLAKLSNLSELEISSMPTMVKDLSPLKKLKNLKLILVDKSSLKEREAEYDEIRKALPECRIVAGFCMGSVWILAVIPAAMVAGLLWRRRRAAGKVA